MPTLWSEDIDAKETPSDEDADETPTLAGETKDEMRTLLDEGVEELPTSAGELEGEMPTLWSEDIGGVWDDSQKALTDPNLKKAWPKV